MLRSKGLGIAALVAAMALTAEVAAQDGSSALNQYEHPMAGDAFFGVPAPWVGGHLVPRGMVTFDYAKDPLILVDENDEVVASPVTSQIHLHFGLSFALWSRLMLSLDLPVAVSQSGEDSVINGNLVQGGADPSPGDLRIGLRGNLFGEYYDPFQIGIGAYLYTPTGGDTGYTGEGAVYGQPQLLIGGRTEFLVYSAKAGALVKGSDNPHTFTYGLGAAVLLLDEKLQIGPEVYGQVAFEDKDFLAGQIQRKGAVNAELIVGAQYYFLDMFVVGAGAGPGLANGVGTPQFRALARLAYDPRPEREKPKAAPADRDGDGIYDDDDACIDVPGVADQDPAKNGCPPDRDGDGILDQDDACPDVPGPANADPAKHGCPTPDDRDGDGVLDPVDACIDVPGVKSDDPKKNGCPPDRDGDGIFDAQDACPDLPGVADADPKKNGCPPDTDGDGINDLEDACVDKPGVPDPDPRKHGCPKVVVTDKEILILQKVEFDFDKATIKPVSDSLLDEVAKTLNANMDIELIEVQGHTDNKGGVFYNTKLSDLRAKAVKDALIARQVDGKRMTSKGYGQAQPIASNDTEEGRAENRRVQFKIVKRAKK
jgi:outer membrane protein OmpA-like peptidoglycan-associated protein